ncbi:MAG: hypothetical protein KF729_15435 [Sandaracinaceae bacterium]|nr:hypothetical protein [Sandaracinaceae bacterium]
MSTSSEQVRVWLDTVLNPLAEAVQEEQAWLARGRTTFRHHLRDLEGIRDTREIVGLRYELNLDQIRRFEPKLAAACERHDDARAALAQAARDAFDTLVAQGAAADSGDDERPYLLEYLIEGLADLPAHYALRETWASWREELVGLWSRDPLLEAPRLELERRRGAMREAADELAAALRERIVALADAHQLAPVRRAEA